MKGILSNKYRKKSQEHSKSAVVVDRPDCKYRGYGDIWTGYYSCSLKVPKRIIEESSCVNCKGEK